MTMSGGWRAVKLARRRAQTKAEARAARLGTLFRERCELTEDCRNELGDRGMDMHGALQNRVGCLGVHGVEHAMDRFVATRAEERSAQNLVRLCVDEHLHETVGLALLEGAGDILHGDLAYKHATAAPSNLSLLHPCPAQRRAVHSG